MRVLGFALAASLTLSACVQTRQYADLQFTPPQGDYKLIVMRPDVSVGSVTTGGMVEPRADWTETARANLIAALKAQQAGRGGNVLVLERRDALAGGQRRDSCGARAAPRGGRQLDRAAQISRRLACRPSAAAGSNIRWVPTRSASARRPAMTMPCSCTPKTGSPRPGGSPWACSGWPAAVIGFCAPMGGGGQFAYASLVDLRTGEVVWFNVLQTGSQVAGITFGDIRKPEGAAQMVERLLGRMKPGRDIRRAAEARQ